MELDTLRSIDRRRLLGALAATAAFRAEAASAEGAAASKLPTLRHVKAGVLDVAYVEYGPSNGRPVVLLHGFPYDVRCFDDVGRRLAKAGLRAIVPYLRGYGPTRFTDAATLRVGQQAALASDLLSFLDALGIRHTTLAGFDWGGRTACVVAALHPGRVNGLVSSGGPAYNVQNESVFLKPRMADWERSQWFYFYLNSKRGMVAFSKDPTAYCRYLWQNFSPTWRFSDATFEATAASFQNPDFVAVALHSYRYRIGGIPGDPALEPIERQLSGSPKITVPTIVVQGADEGVDAPEPMEAIKPHFSQLRDVMVPKGVGHNAPQESPRLFAEAVLRVTA